MLDSQMIKQLEEIYASLEGSVELCYKKSSHSKQQELIEMLTLLATTSEKISVVEQLDCSEVPSFSLKHNGQNVGISFSGIPGGHEFTSLVLAILNSDKKGKLPDDLLLSKMARIKGPIHLKTFVSLSCENCPEVVQSLNLVSIFNSNISHEMIDGSFFQQEINRLGIQGVPSVMDNDQLISAGKIELSGLLTILEKRYGIEESSSQVHDLGQFDTVVIGGGPAGASAAIYTARKGMKTAIIAEIIGGQVKDTKGIENLISVPYIEGPELSAALVKHIGEYDINVFEHRRVATIEQGDLKKILLESGEFLQAKSIIIATGAKWRELGISGEKEYIGRGVAFCPHCDGPYYKGKDIAVIGGGNSGVEAAIDLAGIVKSVTLYEFLPELKADAVLVKKLESLANVKIIKNAKTTEVIGDGTKVTAIKYQDRESDAEYEQKLDGIFVQIGLMPNSSFVDGLVELNHFGEIVVDEKCHTNQSGIYAAGDVTTVPYKQIIISMGEGAKAGLAAFEQLMLK